MANGEEQPGQPARPGSGGAPPPDPTTMVTPASTAVAAPPPPPVADGRVPCPRCGELAEPGQEVCLRCGAMVGRSYRRPPSWRIPAALAALGVLLIGAGAGFGVAELTHHKDSKKKPISLTPKQPVAPRPVPTTPPAVTTPTTPPTTTPSTTTTAPTTSPSPGQSALTTWPPGSSGWTVLLTTTTDRKQAEDRAHQAAAQQISAGVLKGSDYAGFASDEWIVFMGQYDSRKAATRAEKGYTKKGFAGLPRQIKAKKKK
jgi:hypothetical protein